MVGDVEWGKKLKNEPNEPQGNKEWTVFESFKMLKLKHEARRTAVELLSMYLIRTKTSFLKVKVAKLRNMEEPSTAH